MVRGCAAGALVYLVISGILAAVMTVLCPSALQAEEKAMNRPVSWPSAAEGWKRSDPPEIYNSTTIFKYMDGAAELYLAFNLRTLSAARFENPGKPAIIAEVYEMGSPEDAYGIFAFEQQDPPVGMGQGSEFGGGLLRFWKGRYLVSIFGEEPGPEIEKATLMIGRMIADDLAGSGSPPDILNLTPDNALSFASKKAWFLRSHVLLNQRFFIAQTNLFKFAPDVAAVLVRYETKGGRIHVLLVRYPSPERATEALAAFRNGYMGDGGMDNAVRRENGKWTAVERLNQYVVATFDAPDEALARGLIKSTVTNIRGEGS
jgi:hypothetical protein